MRINSFNEKVQRFLIFFLTKNAPQENPAERFCLKGETRKTGRDVYSRSNCTFATFFVS